VDKCDEFRLAVHNPEEPEVEKDEDGQKLLRNAASWLLYTASEPPHRCCTPKSLHFNKM
jgi:hypothetical protein